MRYKGEHKQQTRDKILNASARAIREQGPDRVGVAAVMAEAGLTHGGFYAHFPSKDALLAASFEEMFEFADSRAANILQAKDAREALATYIDFYLSETHCHARDRGCPIAALGSDLPRLDNALKEVFFKGMARHLKRFSAVFREIGVDDPETAARSFRSELVGALISARIADPKERKAVLEASRKALRYRFNLPA